MMARPAAAPTTMPAIAPPDMPEGSGLGGAGVPVGEEVEVEVDEPLVVVVDAPVDDDDTAVLARFLVENTVGSAVCVVAVTLLTPSAAR